MTEHTHEASNSSTFTDPQFAETLQAGNGGVANAAVDLKLYDTASHEVSRFEPIQPGKVGMYVCGATVQSSPHIGHIRAGVAFDIIRRWFLRLGYRVTFIRNVTDIDDKILDKAAAAGQRWWARAYHYEQEFTGAYEQLGVLPPTYEPRATGHIMDMIHLIERIIDNGHAYVVRDENGELTGDVYFDVASWPHYGELTHQKQTTEVDEAAAVADRMGPSVDATGEDKYNPVDPADLSEDKRDPRDFALWKRPKATDPADARWKTPFGTGRPGWHIECSAMSYRYLDGMFDIHGGGADLVFPHHENERAQSETAYGCTFAKYWMHSGMLQVNAEKMSKSLGNFLLLTDVLDNTRPAALRMLMLQTHYRSPLDFSIERLAEADAALSRIENTVRNVGWLASNAVAGAPNVIDDVSLRSLTAIAHEDFISAMDDDFNAPAALGAIFKLVGDLNAMVADKTLSVADAEAAVAARDAIVELMGVLGVDLVAVAEAEQSTAYPPEVVALAAEFAGYGGAQAEEAVEALLEARTQARAEKDWTRADGVRDGLADLGFIIEDTPQGARVTYEG